MLGTVIGEAAASEAVKLAVRGLVNKLGNVKGVQRVDCPDPETVLAEHVKTLGKWAAEISFKDLWKSKGLSESFVNLDLALGEFRDGDTKGEARRRVSDVLDIRGHLVLLGDPGAGKTTSLKKTAQLALERMQGVDRGRVPILVRLREIGRESTLVESLLAIFGTTLVHEEKPSAKARAQASLSVAARLLESSCSVLLLDGLDELHPVVRETVVGELRHLCERLEAARVILTCRTGDFRYHLERTTTLTIRPLSEPQIRQFATRWLGRDLADEFLVKIRDNPYSGSEVRPLTLAHLCAIYERSGTVPDKPKTVYRKIIRLFLEEWDEERSIRRHSKYSNFEVDRKEEFLEALAYYTAHEYQRAAFSGDELRQAYLDLHSAFGLPKSEVGKVIAEVQSHTGLIIEVARDEFEFAHKSLQEYLAGSYIAKLPAVPASGLLDMPNEAALAVTVSSRPGEYFAALVRRLSPDSYQVLAHFTEPFIQRLLIERVEWTVSRVFGTAVLDLYTRTCFEEVGRKNTGISSTTRPLLLQFMSARAVASSIALVINENSVMETRGGIFIVLDSRRGAARQYEHYVERDVLELVRKYIAPERWNLLFGRRQEAKGSAG